MYAIIAEYLKLRGYEMLALEKPEAGKYKDMWVVSFRNPLDKTPGAIVATYLAALLETVLELQDLTEFAA